ncbi:hypothetical protein MASR2M74_07860 [Paracoccaceae bacterium]
MSELSVNQSPAEPYVQVGATSVLKSEIASFEIRTGGGWQVLGFLLFFGTLFFALATWGFTEGPEQLAQRGGPRTIQMIGLSLIALWAFWVGGSFIKERSFYFLRVQLKSGKVLKTPLVPMHFVEQTIANIQR